MVSCVYRQTASCFVFLCNRSCVIPVCPCCLRSSNDLPRRSIASVVLLHLSTSAAVARTSSRRSADGNTLSEINSRSLSPAGVCTKTASIHSCVEADYLSHVYFTSVALSRSPRNTSREQQTRHNNHEVRHCSCRCGSALRQHGCFRAGGDVCRRQQLRFQKLGACLFDVAAARGARRRRHDEPGRWGLEEGGTSQERIV